MSLVKSSWQKMVNIKKIIGWLLSPEGLSFSD